MPDWVLGKNYELRIGVREAKMGERKLELVNKDCKASTGSSELGESDRSALRTSLRNLVSVLGIASMLAHSRLRDITNARATSLMGATHPNPRSD